MPDPRPARSVRSFWRAVCVSGAVAVPVQAQLLNLDPAGAPAPGAGKAALGLAGAIDADIGSLADAGTARGRIKVDLRRLAGALLRSGESLGEPGSVHILAARTLWLRIGEADALVDSLAGARPGAVGEVAAQLERDLGISDASAAPQVPADPRALDRYLRDALALLADAGAAAPAAGAGEALADHLARWSAAGLAAPDAASLAEIDAVLGLAQGWSAYRPAAAYLRRLLAAAGDAAYAPPAWFTAELKKKLGEHFRQQLVLLASDNAETRDSAGPRLRVIALAARAAALVDQQPLRGKALQQAREAVVKAVVGALESGFEQRLRTIEQVLEAAQQREALGDENAVAREARPAWRTLDARAHEARLDLLNLLGRIEATAPPADPAADPAVVAALVACRRAYDDLRAVQTVSRWLEEARKKDQPEAPGAARPSPPPSSTVHNKGAAYILRLSQGFLKPATLDSSLEKMRTLAHGLGEFLEFPGEDGLRAGASEYLGVVGKRAAELAGEIDNARTDWLNAWTEQPDRPEPIQAAAARLRLMRRLVMALEDGATLARIERDPAASALQAWPGWEMSPKALEAITARLPEQLSGAVKTLLDQTDEKGRAAVAKALDGIDKEYAAARLAAALEREAEGRKIVRAPVLVEVGATPAAGDELAWRMEMRGPLAAICRYAEEYAGGGDAKVLAYLNGLGADGLRRVHGER